MGDENLGTTEERAVRMGWVPEDQFKGDPDRWVPAEQFIERANTMLPVAKGTITKLEGLVASLEQKIAAADSRHAEEMRNLKTSTDKFVQFARESEKRAYDKALAELKEKMKLAAEDRDVAGVERIGQEIEDHIKSHPAVTGEEAKPQSEKPKAGTDPLDGTGWFKPDVAKAWEAEHTWYNTVPKMAIFAGQVDAFLMRTKPTQSHAERLAGIAEAVKEEFPEYFSNPNRERPASVEGGGGGERPGGNGKRSYANLTPEAKAYCDEWAGMDGKGKTGTISGFTRDEYLSQAGPECFKS